LTRLLHLPQRRAVAADLLAILAFVTIGLVNHHGGLTATGYAEDFLPIAGCWLVGAGTFDLYRRPRLGALLATWVTGVTGGIVIRALVRRHVDGGDAVFLAVALCFSLLFVLVFRSVAAVRLRPATLHE
jgi:hypothetical protein